VQFLEKEGIAAAAIHGNKSQNHRTKVLAEFKTGKLQILVATDIAARGIDISQLPCVINFDLPQVPEDYVHRIGRTGRAGSEGEAFSLVCDEEVDMLRAIERLTGGAIPRAEEAGFELSRPLPQYAPKTATNSRQRNSGGRSQNAGNGDPARHRNGGGNNNRGRSGNGRARQERNGSAGRD